MFCVWSNLAPAAVLADLLLPQASITNNIPSCLLLHGWEAQNAAWLQEMNQNSWQSPEHNGGGQRLFVLNYNLFLTQESGSRKLAVHFQVLRFLLPRGDSWLSMGVWGERGNFLACDSPGELREIPQQEVLQAIPTLPFLCFVLSPRVQSGCCKRLLVAVAGGVWFLWIPQATAARGSKDTELLQPGTFSAPLTASLPSLTGLLASLHTCAISHFPPYNSLVSECF